VSATDKKSNFSSVDALRGYSICLLDSSMQFSHRLYDFIQTSANTATLENILKTSGFLSQSNIYSCEDDPPFALDSYNGLPTILDKNLDEWRELLERKAIFICGPTGNDFFLVLNSFGAIS
jgi:hypothetical protein